MTRAYRVSLKNMTQGTLKNCLILCLRSKPKKLKRTQPLKKAR
jgi:hypothetical protein